jgi:Concanavalin A-like lectin/glucanases superfamily
MVSRIARAGTWSAFAFLAIVGTLHAQFPNDFKFGDELTGTDFTIAAWYNAPSAQLTDAAIISNKNWDSGGNPGFVLTADARGGGTGHQWKVNANGVGGARADTDWTDYNLNQWVYIVATFDRTGDLVAYTNGGTAGGGATSTRTTPFGLIDTDGSPNFYDLNIGQDGTGNYSSGQGFIGLVDDVAVWRRALDSTEVAGLYSRAVNNNQSLGALAGTSLNGGVNNIDASLVGYYAFDGNLNDGAGTPQNGIARLSGGAPGTVGFAGGRFGQAAQLTGGNYVTIGDAVAPADATFTGNSAANNNASNAGNWDLNPALLTSNQGIIVGSGTTSTFSGANTGPAIFDGTFPVSTIKNVTFGQAGVSTFINFQNSGSGGANILGVGADSRIGVTGSNVTLNMSGSGRIEHRGSGEEAEELIIGQAGSTVNVTMSGTTEIASGPKVADATFATGFRRPLSTDPPGTPPRTGDDLKIGTGNNAAAVAVNLTMSGDSVVFASDVLQTDSNNSTINIVQNDNSQILANWDTRIMTTGGHDANDVINWTMNGNSKFKVGRDHGFGEAPGTGVMNLTVNNNAEVYAGDRIALGADGGRINVVVNSGLMKVGGNTANDVIMTDETGENPSSVPTVDWILNLGSGADADLKINGGRVEVGRNTYLGRGGGTGKISVNGGTLDVKGVGPVGVGLGNTPSGSIPGGVNWVDNGGDVIVGYDQGDAGTLEFQRGQASIARDLIITFDNDFNGVAGNNTLRLVSDVAGSSFTVGDDLSFNGDEFAASGGMANFNVTFQGSTITPINVADDLLIYNNGSSTSNFSLSVAQGGTAPTVGQYVLIDYAGTRSGDFFTTQPANGITYNLIYDDANTRVLLNITAVTLLDADFNNDGLFNCVDIDALTNAVATNGSVAQFDLNGDGSLSILDVDKWRADAGAANNIGTSNVYRVGDANLDGVVDGTDFGLWNANKFTNNKDWCKGNFNADAVTDGSDFGLWNANKFTSSDSSVVPEPAAGLACGFWLACLVAMRRRGGSALK